jgi:hypothetical protein
MSSLTSISASPIEQLPGQIRKLVDVGHGQRTEPEMRRELMYSTTSSASTIRNAGTRGSVI